MKITLKELLKQNNKAIVSLTVKQETSPFNNYTPTVELDSLETTGFSDNQIITKAWNKVKPNIITGMKRVNQCMGLEWVEEALIYEGFKYEEMPIIPIVNPVKLQQEVNRELQIQNNLLELKIALLMDEMGVIS